MSCYPKKKRIRNKLLWVGGTLDDMVAGPKLRENNRP